MDKTLGVLDLRNELLHPILICEFISPFAKKKYFELITVSKRDKFGVTVQIKGSEIKAQLDAIVYDLARALENYMSDI